jgi:hypothetical protein
LDPRTGLNTVEKKIFPIVDVRLFARILSNIVIIYMYYRAVHVARMGEKRNAYRILVGLPEGKRPLGRPRRRWVDNIKIDLRGIEWLVWIGLIWLRIGTSGGLL